MNLKDMVKINNRFEKSINLQLDLEDPSKLEYYIPTRASAKIIGDYLDEVKNFSGNRSTLLVGPYGKGKSHLILVLLAILSRPQDGKVKKLVERIAIVDPAAGTVANELMSEDRMMLPVIVNTSGGNLNQVFLRSLNQALARAGLSDIIPDNLFTEVKKTLSHWERDYAYTYQKFCNLLSSIGYTQEEFKEKISNYDEKALNYFRQIHPELTSGSEFNPVLEEEIIHVYRSVNRCICEKKGYRGIYIIFDEFSKYIEGHATDGFANDMKVLQDICELCNSSKEEQMHLICVAHKSIKAYANTLQKEILNTFKGVEGRLKEVLFVVSSQNNYELIADVIHKEDAFYEWIKVNKMFKAVLNESYHLPGFSTLFTKDDFNKIVGSGCYPLTPLAAMLLLNLSEKVAQNERTIFTFLANRTDKSLVKLISRKKTTDFIGADSIYDYFEPLFKEETQIGIHNEWLKAEYALSKVNDSCASAIIKCLSVVRMVNKPDEIPAKKKFLMLSTGIYEVEFQKALDMLCDEGLVVYKDKTGVYDFKNNVGIDVERTIADCMAQHFMKIDLCKILHSVMNHKYILPKKHNQSYCMTRYFSFLFMEDNTFISLPDTSYLYEEEFSDGKVLFIVPRADIGEEEIADHIKELGDSCLLVIMPSDFVDITNKARYLSAISYLIEDKGFVESNQVLLTELRNQEMDIKIEINEWINETYLKRDYVFRQGKRVPVGRRGLNRTVSDVCDASYNETPIINHELINRHEISGQILKARNIIVDTILKKGDIDKFVTGTSPESTIYRATLIHTANDSGLRQVKKEINGFISGCNGQKVSFGGLIEKLTNRPIGLRKEVLPIYFAECLMQLEDLPVIYLNDKEMELDSGILNNILKCPDSYFLFVEEENIQKNEYLREIEELFAEYMPQGQEMDWRQRPLRLSSAIQSWYRSLPQTSVTFSNEDYEGQPLEDIKAFRKLFTDSYLNPRELIFEQIPNMCKAEGLERTVEKVKRIKRDIDRHLHLEKQVASLSLRETFGFEKDANLRQSLLSWYDSQGGGAKTSILNSRAHSLMAYIKNIQTNDEDEIIGRIAKAVTDLFIEDWNDSMQAVFQKELQAVREEIEVVNEQNYEGKNKLSFVLGDGTMKMCTYDFDLDNISTSAFYFKNTIEAALEENESMETNEKLGVLMNIIAKLLE